VGIAQHDAARNGLQEKGIKVEIVEVPMLGQEARVLQTLGIVLLTGGEGGQGAGQIRL
jgi:hypothetical protein